MPKITALFSTVALRLSAGVVALGLMSQTVVAQEPALTIGSAAPSIDIEHWVSDGNGAFKPFNNFEAGKVYVVEFWATWCGPCVASMPHISELQDKYADRGVTVVSVSSESLDEVTAFLEREVRGQENEDGDPLTFGELTSNYCLTTDPDGSVNTAYMDAAGQNGIPCAFVVGKDGRIEWIGHPMRIDEPLEQVVVGQWDRDAFAEEFKAKQRFELATQRIMMLLRGGKIEDARAMVTELAASATSPQMKAQAEQIALQVEFMVYQGQIENDQAAAIESMAKLVEKAGGSLSIVDSAAYAVARHADKGSEVSADLLAAAVKQVQAVLDEENPNASLLDTLAHLVYHQGDLDLAIELEETASANARGRLKRSIDAYLEQLKAEKQGDAEPAEEAAAE